MFLKGRSPYWLVFCAINLCVPAFAAAFSLGIRANAGAEMLSLSAVKLERADDQAALTKTDDIKRIPIFFGADLVVTPVFFGDGSISALVGFRSTSVSTKGPDAYNDDISFSYLPVGVSYDHLLGKLRASAYFAYDLGLSPKVKFTVDKTKSSLDAKISGLSRLRFGALAEFFLMPSLSLHGQTDFATGSFKNDAGELKLIVSGEETLANYKANTNKISGLTFGGGVSYYIMPPKPGVDSSAKGKPAPGKKTGKPGVKKGKPKPKPKAPPAEF